jgi:probable rRNA maturation factor
MIKNNQVVNNATTFTLSETIKNQISIYFLSMDTEISDPNWGNVDVDKLSQIAIHTLTEVKWTRLCYLSVLFTNDVHIQELNHHYREKNKATNVLSFQGYDEDLLKIYPKSEQVPLGDIVLAFETVQIEASDQQKTFENHYMHLFVHGLLHLLGFDHENSTDAEEMEQLEIKILNHFSIINPYEY